MRGIGTEQTTWLSAETAEVTAEDDEVDDEDKEEEEGGGSGSGECGGIESEEGEASSSTLCPSDPFQSGSSNGNGPMSGVRRELVVGVCSNQ